MSLGRHEQRPPNERGTDRSAFAELETEPQQDDKTTPRRDQDADDLLEGTDRPASVRTVKVGEPEAVLGPAWEEPSSRAVSHDASSDAAADDRDLPTAVISGAVLLAAALIAAALSKTAFAVVAGLVVLVAQAELYAAMRRAGYQPASALGLAIGALVLAGAYLRGEPAMVFFLALGLVLSFLWYMAAPPKSRAATVSHLGATVLGLVYVPFLAGFALTILSMPWGRAFTLAVLGLTFLYDTTAFVIGRTWGSRPLAPTVSPRKSWEGLSAATVVTVAVAIAVLPSIAPIDPSWARAIAAGLVVVVFAPLGDLAESLLKRDLGVKDMGGFLPGHGGILDRIDSVLFVAPAVFYFLRLIL